MDATYMDVKTRLTVVPKNTLFILMVFFERKHFSKKYPELYCLQPNQKPSLKCFLKNRS